MSLNIVIFAIVTLLNWIPSAAETGCGKDGVWLQVLGSGGPESNDARASSGYLIWHKNKARLLIDLGGGSMLRFEQSRASVNDLDGVLFSHLHVDHSNDLPVLIKAGFFSDRNRVLVAYGPSGNSFMPSFTDYVQRLFGNEGVYSYLSRYVNGSDSYRLLPHNVDININTSQVVWEDTQYHISAVAVHHGALPALAWRVAVNGKIIVFSGDMNNDNDVLATLAKQADILVAHHAIPEGASGVARNLHMPPSIIGKIAAAARIKQLVLSHRMNRTLGQEKASEVHIRKTYQGPMHFAEDLQCFSP